MRISDWSSDVCSSDLQHHNVGVQHERPGDGDALALAAGEHVRIALVVLRPQADSRHHGFRRLTPLGRRHLAIDDQRLLQDGADLLTRRSEEHTSELQSLMRISYAVFCLKKKTTSQPQKLPKVYQYSTPKSNCNEYTHTINKNYT